MDFTKGWIFHNGFGNGFSHFWNTKLKPQPKSKVDYDEKSNALLDKINEIKNTRVKKM